MTDLGVPRAGLLSPLAGAAGRADPLPAAVAVYVACVILPLGFQAGPLNLTTLRLLLLALLVPLYVNILSGKYGRVYAPDFLFPLYIVWTFISLMANNPHMAISNTGSSGVEFLGGYALGRAFVRSEAQFLKLCKVLMLSVLVLFPFAVIEAVTGRSILLNILQAVPVFSTVAEAPTDVRLGLDRAQLAFAHPIHYGLYCSMVVPMAFVAMRGHVSEGWRWTATILVILAGFLSLSSGAILAVALQIFMLVWAATFAKFEWRWWLLLGLIVLAYIVVDLLSNRTPIRVFMSYATFSPASAYWRATIFEWGMVNVRANPLLGIGFNDWVRPEWMHSSSVDNFWLLTTMRHGVPGFAMLIVGFLVPLIVIIGRKITPDTALFNCRRTWVFIIAGLTFSLCTVHVWHNVYSFVFFIFGAGIWLLSAEEPKDGAPEQEAQAEALRGMRYSRFGAGGADGGGAAAPAATAARAPSPYARQR